MLRPPPTSTLFPYTTLFRSSGVPCLVPALLRRYVAPHRFHVERRGRGEDLVERSCRQRSGADRKSTRLNSSHRTISYAVFCLKKKKITKNITHSTITRGFAR